MDFSDFLKIFNETIDSIRIILRDQFAELWCDNFCPYRNNIPADEDIYLDYCSDSCPLNVLDE